MTGFSPFFSIWQYMSAIFYHDEEQKLMAEKTFEEAQSKIARPIKTSILPFTGFYEAEDYHQKYLLQRHPGLLNALDVEPGEELIRSHVLARINGYLGGYGTVLGFDKEWKDWGITEKMAEYVRAELVSSG
ncbi:Peptide methionine sulfoxide reductase [Chionoecetes opilio]|uniref:peptide-methionine (S)-S-oxide reductase n=1 Tax=Chionoecetes opilio TaxID=41210 RepID=A0A8J4Y199_CHIOP|nr:Peptide methionine sulfoxide reductase [Chionoecetes opilio]